MGLLEEFLPVYDVSDSVATLVKADLGTTWRALMDADLIEVGRKRPMVGVLGGLRVLPDIVMRILHGEPLQEGPRHLRLRDMPSLSAAQGGWVLLGEQPEHEIALGLVGKFWRPIIEFVEVPRDQFRAFAAPGFAKTVYSLSVSEIEGQTLLSGTMRTATTDDHARDWFRRYWTFGVGSGAHVLVSSLLDVVREHAEAQSRVS
jgi:hypothetical protein